MSAHKISSDEMQQRPVAAPSRRGFDPPAESIAKLAALGLSEAQATAVAEAIGAIVSAKPAVPDDDDLVDEKGAARMTGFSRWFFRKRRSERTDGPPYLKLGASVRYRVGDLRAWFAEHTRSSTSQETPAEPRRLRPVPRKKRSSNCGQAVRPD